MVVEKAQEASAKAYLKKLIYEGRLPANTTIRVEVGRFLSVLKKAPSGDIHMISITEDDHKEVRNIAQVSGKSFLFVSDSRREDILS